MEHSTKPQPQNRQTSPLLGKAICKDSCSTFLFKQPVKWILHPMIPLNNNQGPAQWVILYVDKIGFSPLIKKKNKLTNFIASISEAVSGLLLPPPKLHLRTVSMKVKKTQTREESLNHSPICGNISISLFSIEIFLDFSWSFFLCFHNLEHRANRIKWNCLTLNAITILITYSYTIMY